MYAIVKVGGKQYRVEQGDSLLVDRMPEDEGAKVALEPLLLKGDGDDDAVFAGDDLAKVKVEAVVKGHERGPKVHVLKFKPKRGYKRRYGHRSDLTRIEIGDMKLLSRNSTAKTVDEPKAEAAEKPKSAEKPKAEPKQGAAKKPAAKKADDKPAAKKAPAKKAAAKKSDAKPAAKKPAAKKPAAKKPAAKKKKEDGDGA